MGVPSFSSIIQHFFLSTSDGVVAAHMNTRNTHRPFNILSRYSISLCCCHSVGRLVGLVLLVVVGWPSSQIAINSSQYLSYRRNERRKCASGSWRVYAMLYSTPMFHVTISLRKQQHRTKPLGGPCGWIVQYWSLLNSAVLVIGILINTNIYIPIHLTDML